MNESGQGYEQERALPRTDGYQPIRAEAAPPPGPTIPPRAAARPAAPAQSAAPERPAPAPERPAAPAAEPPRAEEAINFASGDDTAGMTEEERARAAMTPEERERADAMDDPLAHPLTKPIEAHGEMISILHWREPTGGDIEKAGNPISIELEPNSGRYRVSFDEKKMTAMMVHLAGVPPHTIRALRAGDWTAIATKIFRFFA
jgi:hypothetical protein